MEPHTLEMWTKIFNKLPSPSTETAEETIANRIIADMVGYRHRSRFRQRDVKELANALQAYARMVQEYGVKV